MIEDAKLAKNTGETMFNTTLERKRRAADMAVIDPIAQDHRERIRQQEEIANKITNVITPQMADEQAKAQAAQQQQQQLMGQLVGMQAPEQKRGQMGIADILSAGIAALFGGAQGVNQAIEGGYQRAGQDAQMQFQNEGRQFEQQQQNIMLQLQQLGLDEKTAQHAFEVLQGRQFELEDQKRAQDAKAMDPNQVLALYGSANSAAEKRLYGAELQRRGIPIANETIEADARAIDDEIKAKAAQKQVAARDKALRAVIPYATNIEERNKLIDWAVNMRPEELDIVAGLSDAEIYKRAQTAKTNVETQFLEKTLDDRVNIIASNKGIKDTQFQIIKKDLQFYDADRALKVATARARIAASNRSNQGGGGGGGGALSPTEERLQNGVIVKSTKELMDLAHDQLMQEVPVTKEGRKLTGPELIKRAEIMARNGDPVVTPLLNQYKEHQAEYQRLMERAAAGGNAPMDMGMGGNPFSGQIGAALGGMTIHPEKTTQPKTKKKTQPAKAKVTSRGNWKVEVER